MSELENVRSFLFVDEVKNSLNNKDGDNSFYYFAVAVSKSKINEVNKTFKALTHHLPNGFHAKKHYKLSTLDLELLNRLTDMFIDFRLPTICFRYDKDLLYKLSKQYLKNIPNEEINGRIFNWEFQAFFYFVQNLHLFLTKRLDSIENPVCCFFDRGIYGLDDIEAIDFDNSSLFRAVFTSRNKIELLALPDHLGYIFGKCRKDYLNGLDKNTTLNILKNNYYGQQLLKLANNNLFKYIEAEEWLKAMKTG